MKIIETEDKTIVLGSNFGSKVIWLICCIFLGSMVFLTFNTKFEKGMSTSDWVWFGICILLFFAFIGVFVSGIKQKMTITESTIDMRFGLHKYRIENEPIQIHFTCPLRFPGWQVHISAKANSGRSVFYHFARKKKAQELVDVVQRRYKQPIEINPPNE
ncbi:hypothetical protein ACLVWU_08645 [Bdellovibrio sp. HCB290]|uniref:hypothetical protein n=1 Tax=Bdellovibrio sp. HCB290 TaxID=3394356 RepID=UPI0039B46F2E